MTRDPAGRRPTVSVVLAARDAAGFLEETLASLEAQTHPAFELVAVDDGSRDATGAVLEAHAERSRRRPDRPVRVLRTEPLGLAAARNRAIAEAGGDILVLLDGDDVLRPTLIEKARRRLAEGDALDVVYPLFEHVGPGGEPLGVRTRPPRRSPTPADLLLANPIHSDSGVALRRSAALAAGGFDEALTGYVGLDFWRRVLSLRPANAQCLPELLVLYRRHPSQITSSTERMRRNFSRVVAKIEPGDPGITPRTLRRARAAQRLYWASVAHAGADHRGARSHTAEAWRIDPTGMALTPLAHLRALTALASLMPAPLHEAARRVASGMPPRRRRRDVPPLRGRGSDG